MIKPQKLKPCACIITHGNPSFAVCTEFEGVSGTHGSPLPTPLVVVGDKTNARCTITSYN